jgi:hypothetical protein
VEQTTVLPIDVANGVPGIEAAALLGVDVGDELRLVAPGGTQGVGTAVVSRLEGSRAVLSVTLLAGGDAASGSMPDGVVAVRARSRQPRFPVALDDTSSGDELHLLVEQSTHLRVAVGDEPALARVVRREHGLAVLDPLEAPWRTEVVPSDRAGIRRTLSVLEEIAIGRRLLDLSSGVGASELTNPIDIVFGVVEEGVLRPLERHGQRLRAGELVSLTVRNASAAHVFAWVFDVGVSGRASLLTNSASGVLLGAAGSADDTATILSASGRALEWPRDVPTGAAPGAHDSARHETFVVVLADRRGDLSSLAPPARTARGDAPEGDLAALFGRRSITTREVAEEVAFAEPLRYRVEEVSFFLCPP